MANDVDLIGEALPNYEVEGELGRGGWGIVLGARHRTLDRPVAIKQLPRAFASDPEVRARFVAEAKVLAGLSHPHIVPVYDYVENESMCLLVMEALPGGTVWKRFVEQGFAPETSCVAVLATLAGLEAAHRQGVLHRDIKPENLLFSEEGVLKVADFGIAKVVGGGRTVATRAGEILGTPAYIAPEQVTGGELGPSTDIYATAVMLYELLAGRLPYPDEGDPIVVVYRHVHEDPVPLRDVAPQIGPHLAEVVMRGLARDVGDRYATAEEFAVAIGTAATADWGEGWEERAGMPLLASPRVMATTRATGPPLPLDRQGGSRPTVDVGSAPPPGPTGPPPPPPPPGRDSGGSGEPSPPARSTVVVRPAVAEHQAADLADVEPAELVPVERLVSGRRAAVLPTIVALALLAAAFAVGLIGLRAPGRGGELSAGEVTVAGVDVAGGQDVELDLDEEISLEVASAGAAPVEVELSLTALGVPLGDDRGELDGSGATQLDLSGSRYLVTGTVTGKVTLHDAAGSTRTHEFPVTSAGSPWLTVPGIACVIAVLVLVAFAESFLRSLRRGRKRFAGRVGLVIVGAALGVVVALVGWVAGSGEPAIPTLIVAGALGAAAGVAAGVAAGRLSTRARRSPKPARA